ncbi:DNA-binding PadR family transcriptional regulator [Silvibacterium bohemicum]|uniref:DNA-binding PadR family transcriptional regulator n=1 Tax=Silvibacterium bohemicum TaxID=1577686 RepID=A0A841JLP6_9BACT|nr:PadR family transcriptional regulator [Silvibacterium bohemicum]MBB6142276.1 DNA-binding PadR family transcriptional regulator [Silvibacterium bohemicum]
MGKEKKSAPKKPAAEAKLPLSDGNPRQSREKASRFAVLGMLSLGKKSGYDIKKQIETSTSNFWSESYGNIYPMLKKLLAEGAIREEKSTPTAGGRQKQLYSITANGLHALQEWLRQPALPGPEDNELLLKLFFSAIVKPQDSRALLKSFRNQVAGELARYGGIEDYILSLQATKAQKTYWLATLHYGQAVSRALLQWSEATDKAIKELDE